MILVECPICHHKKKVYTSQHHFRCCSMLFDVESCKIIEGVSLKRSENSKTDSIRPQKSETENQDVENIIDDKTDTKKQQKDDDVVLIVDDEDGDNNG